MEGGGGASGPARGWGQRGRGRVRKRREESWNEKNRSSNVIMCPVLISRSMSQHAASRTSCCCRDRLNDTRSGVKNRAGLVGVCSRAATWVLGEVRSPVELALVVGRVGLTRDGGGSAVRQRAAHLLVLGLLRRAVHAVELRGT